jgi:hypothetical protein
MSENEPGKLPPPIPLALGFCDTVWRQPATGKRFILGSINGIASTEFPAKISPLGIFADLTNGRGHPTIRMQLIDADEERPPVWEHTFTADFDSPKVIAEIDLMVGVVEFPEPGEYRLQMFSDGQFVVERPFIASKIEVE